MSSEGLQSDTPRNSICAPVFYTSIVLTVAFVILGVSAPDFAGRLFGATQAWIVEAFGWFYLLAVAGFLVFAVALGASRFGEIKLGPEHSQPDFSYPAWFSMLFAAGMGIGLLFFSVAEPIAHTMSPPEGEGGTIEAARQAMATTFFHWGLHAWAIYAVIGMVLAYFGFRHGLPLSIRSALYPLLGERIYGPIGHAVDIFAVVGTLFGIATSLGLGVVQINAGLNHVLGVPLTTGVQALLIVVITAVATVSVILGLQGGIRRLSSFNLVLAFFLLVFVLFTGPTQHLLQALVQNTGNYLGQLVNMTFHLYAYEPREWIGDWTLFYWAWWISWSPFVGMFIARISRGRTIREFVFGVLFIPAGVTFLWMTVFGNTAISLDFGVAEGAIAAAVDRDISLASFQMLEHLPWSTLTSLVAVLLVAIFFVTSADSGSLVVVMLTSGGHTDPPLWQRIFWASIVGVVAMTLLLAGGLSSLQSAVIASALPFTFVMLLLCYGLLTGLRREGLKMKAQERLPSVSERLPWESRLRRMVSFPSQQRVQTFFDNEVSAALGAVKSELEAHGAEVTMQKDDERAELTVHHHGGLDFVYAAVITGHIAPSFVIADLNLDEKRQNRYYRIDVHLAEGSQDYDIMGYTREQIINDILSQYDRHLQYLHMAHGSELAPPSDSTS